MPQIGLSLVQVVFSLLAAGCLALAAFGIGHIIISGLRLHDDDDFLFVAVWSAACGLLIVALAWIALGRMGFLYRGVLVAMTIASAFWSLGEAAQFYFSWRAARRRRIADAVTFADPPPRWLTPFVVGLWSIAGAATLVHGLSPPIAGEGMYARAAAIKEMMRCHSTAALPLANHGATSLMDSLWVWGWAIHDPVAAQLCTWSVGLLLALASVLLATPCLGIAWAWIVGGLVLMAPCVSQHLFANPTATALALWISLAINAWQRGRNGALRWMYMAGAMIGAAIATQPIALPLVGALGLLSTFAAARNRTNRRELMAIGKGMIVGLVVAAWWLLPSNGPVAVSVAIGSPLVALGSVAHVAVGRLGFLVIALLPGIFFVRRLNGLRPMLVLLAVFVVCGVLWRHYEHFAYSLLPIASTAAAWPLAELRRMPVMPRSIAITALAVIAMVTAAGVLRDSSKHLTVALGLESREKYLRRNEPSFAAVAILNRLAGKNCQILSDEEQAIYFEGRLVREADYRERTHYDARFTSPAALSVYLKEQGFTHLLVRVSQPSLTGSRSALASRIEGKTATDRWLSRHLFLPLATYSTARNETAQVYRLLMLR